jgi:hypothetical protein
VAIPPFITEIFLRGLVTEDEMSAGVDGGSNIPFQLGICCGGGGDTYCAVKSE